MFQKTFLRNMTASAKCHSFSLLRRLYQQSDNFDLGYVVIIFNYFQIKTP